MADRLLKVQELADRMSISPHTLKKWRMQGWGPPYKRLRGDRGEIRYCESKVDAWMKSDLHESFAQELSKRSEEDIEVLNKEGQPRGPLAKQTGFDMRTGRFIEREENQ